MHRLFTLLGATVLSLSLAAPALADAAVKAEMRIMGQNLKAAESAKDAAALKQALQAIHDAARTTQGKVQAVSQPNAWDKTYLEGIGKLLTALQQSIQLADRGQLDAARQSLNNVKAIRNEYHKKLID